MLRVVRIIALADEAFGVHDRAIYWLSDPSPVFDDEAPMTLTDTEIGAEWVEGGRERMLYGVHA